MTRVLLVWVLVFSGVGAVAADNRRKSHVPSPVVRPNSNVLITLERSACFGSCPSYIVNVGTNGIEFEGQSSVVAQGKHKDTVEPGQVREFAKRFVKMGFYSFRKNYQANMTDIPTYLLSVEIDGRKKSLCDYGGARAGMPKVITRLEESVDEFARTDRWIRGSEGLVSALRAEGFDFVTPQAQEMLKGVISRGSVDAVRELLTAGVPVSPLDVPLTERFKGRRFEAEGWLNVASGHADVLKVLFDAGASKDDQEDKDLALVGAARSDNIEGVKILIAYGANSNADLSQVYVTDWFLNMGYGHQNAGTALIGAAESGDPELVRLILQYHPNLEARDATGRTALFAAAESGRGGGTGESRVKCVDLLANAGANVNTRDDMGETPLHLSFYDDVVQELIRLGADVNAVDNYGQTPIFRNVSNSAIKVFVDHGADLTIRDKRGMDVFEAAKVYFGPLRVEALGEAIKNRKQP